jgi:hypothetical protein
MGNFLYDFEEYKGPKSRYTCVQCGEKREFTRYVNKVTGEYVAEHVGICNNRIRCGYHYSPWQFFADNGSRKPAFPRTRVVAEVKASKRTIPFSVDIVRDSLNVAVYRENSFVNFLLKFLDRETVTGLVEKYVIGTSNHWPGATVFWLINNIGQFVGGQVVLFDVESGHTFRKDERRCTTWVHKALERQYNKSGKEHPDWLKEYSEQAEKYPIPFGLHLTAVEPNKPIAIVEAPKTAVIASAFFPDFVWLAIGSLSWLNKKRLGMLAGRQIFLFPDISSNGRAFDMWNAKANELKDLANVTISDYLEQVATDEEKKKGLDLADYLIKCCLTSIKF